MRITTDNHCQLRGTLVSLLALLPLFTAMAGCAAAVSLFDGNTLDGWDISGDARWSVSERAIVAAGEGDGFLATASLYGDFFLRLEFWVDATVNSGIFVRCQERGNIHPDTCYELNIWDNHPRQEARTGAIVFRVMPPLAHVDTVGRWNTYEVSARGEWLEVRINGVTTAILDNADPSPGFIALQHVGKGTVKFRSIELRLL